MNTKPLIAAVALRFRTTLTIEKDWTDMPNHIINEVTLQTFPVEHVEQYVTGETAIDFEVLLPPPLNCWQGGVSMEDRKLFPANWYDWNRSNWGTKWNAYGLESDAIRQEDQFVILTFRTAWSPPYGWLCALFNRLGCDMKISWLDEGAADGRHEVWAREDKGALGGPSRSSAAIPEGSPEHRRLHKLLWGVEEFEDEDS